MTLRLLLSNGEELEVIGRMSDQVPESMMRRKGWASFYLTNGCKAKVYATDIIAVVEKEAEK